MQCQLGETQCQLGEMRCQLGEMQCQLGETQCHVKKTRFQTNVQTTFNKPINFPKLISSQGIKNFSTAKA